MTREQLSEYLARLLSEAPPFYADHTIWVDDPALLGAVDAPEGVNTYLDHTGRWMSCVSRYHYRPGGLGHVGLRHYRPATEAEIAQAQAREATRAAG